MSFGPTVRDFSKSEVGRKHLQSLFNYEAISCPNLIKIENEIAFDKNVLGRTVEYLLPLVIERQNRNFEFPRLFRDSRTREAKEAKRYFVSGELSDSLIDCLISFGKERQKTFQFVRSKSKRDTKNVRDKLRNELRRIHELASVRKWTVRNLFYNGWLTDARLVAAQADLIVDTTLIEIKTVENNRKHDEHLSQLFAYFLISQAPMRELGAFKINELGIFYARHGILVKQNVQALVRFPINRTTRVAFDFVIEFSKWRTRKLQGEDNNQAVWDVIRELNPKPAWVTKIVEKYKNALRNDFCGDVQIPKIVLPKNFLL